ncbi:ppiCB, peptidyl-prolyl cis-trans isomerase C (rotamase C) [Colwellia psychrerythraea]|uniref:PpiCB, peptidyl-prolyl cis-trans isomerase C (Rotamase C) n=1 Tax=Colwellia psychrerythraea TaxID=28229 RepID=A0A099K9W4_COLPS|nr:ppiCB, peptidyl-prolyl cis-trans isomerase C (rotamase C) [Colwellia psychrerythraea]
MAATAHALHILVKHKEIAEDIIKQLAKGAKFQTLAKNIQRALLIKKAAT